MRYKATRINSRAFTPIELFVVIGVIAVLLAILMSVLFATRERGRRTAAFCEIGFRNGPGEDTVSFSTATTCLDTTDDLKPGQACFGPPGALRHQGGSNYAFADGHVRWYRPEQVAPTEDDAKGVLKVSNGSSPTFAR